MRSRRFCHAPGLGRIRRVDTPGAGCRQAQAIQGIDGQPSTGHAPAQGCAQQLDPVRGRGQRHSGLALVIQIIHNLLRLDPPGLPAAIARQQTRQMIARAGLRDRAGALQGQIIVNKLSERNSVFRHHNASSWEAYGLERVYVTPYRHMRAAHFPFIVLGYIGHFFSNQKSY